MILFTWGVFSYWTYL